MQTMRRFIQDHSVSLEAVMVDRNPHMAEGEWSRTAYHYRVTLRGRFEGKRRQLTTYFSMGPAHSREPEAAEVLDCLASDASGVENARSFEEWAEEYGHDSDSRKAERVYEACRTGARNLRRFCGREAFEALLWDTERL